MSSENSEKPKRPKGKPKETIAFARKWVMKIKQWTKDHTEETFFDDALLQAGVQRAFAAIGESIKDLPDDLLATEPEIAWRDIKGLREIIAHDYWGVVEQSTVWDAVVDDLGLLDAALERLEKKLDG